MVARTCNSTLHIANVPYVVCISSTHTQTVVHSVLTGQSVSSVSLIRVQSKISCELSCLWVFSSARVSKLKYYTIGTAA